MNMRALLNKTCAVLLTLALALSLPMGVQAKGVHKVSPDYVPLEESDVLSDGFQPVSTGEFRGLWFSFRDWQTYLQGKSEAEFRSAFESVCDKSASSGLNTLIVHVRSHNDAVYPSSIYPWSVDMLNGDPGFDPLSVMVEIAHRRGLSFHAWINPYGYRNGEYTGNAALATRENIIGGIREILDRYAVDGIHFDDYFPPLGAESHNALLRDVYSTVHSYGKVFGVSPSGNISNNLANGVDVRTWLSSAGYVDYICPQIYWTDNYGSSGTETMFSDRLQAWKAMDTAGIPMYIGLALYRTGTSNTSDPGWTMSQSNLSGMLQKLRAAGCGGFVLYSYSAMLSPGSSAELSNFLAAL